MRTTNVVERVVDVVNWAVDVVKRAVDVAGRAVDVEERAEDVVKLAEDVDVAALVLAARAARSLEKRQTTVDCIPLTGTVLSRGARAPHRYKGYTTPI